MALVPEPDQTHFILEHAGKLATAITIGFLAFLKLFPQKRAAASIATNVIKERSVTFTDLEVCQLKVKGEFKDILREELKEFREEIMVEVRLIHTRINSGG